MSRRFWVIMVLFAASALLMMYAGLHFAGKFGTATGVVRDAATGEPVPGARVLLAADVSTPSREETLPLRFEAVTDAEGRFRLRTTVGATYRLSVEHPAFEPAVKEGVAVEPEAHNDLGEVRVVRREG